MNLFSKKKKEEALSVKLPICWEFHRHLVLLKDKSEHGLDCHQMHVHEGHTKNHENMCKDFHIGLKEAQKSFQRLSQVLGCEFMGTTQKPMISL
jgi:hypothetical protein